MASFTRPIKWHGTANKYVHASFGDDVLGDGSQQKPWKTLTKAVTSGNSGSIRCIGYFAEDLPRLDNQSTTGFAYGYGRTIIGDQWGAAVFDGKGVFNMWGYYTTNLMIINCLGKRTSDQTDTGFVGVGLSVNADRASSPGGANAVSGVSGTSVLLHNSFVNFGCMKTNNSYKTNLIFSKCKANKNFGWLYFGGSSYGAATLTNGTFYDIAVTERKKSRYAGSYRNSIFAKCAMIINEANSLTWIHCLFTADTDWYYFTADTASSPSNYVKICSGSEISSVEDLDAKIAQYNADHGTSYARSNNTFTDCVFGTQTSAQVLNDPENLDFTVKPNSEGVIAGPYVGSDVLYFGALPPAYVVNWNESTKSGCIEFVNGKVCLNTLSASSSGSVLSDVISINPAEIQINGVYGYHIPLFRSHRTLTCNPTTFVGTPVLATITDGDNKKSVTLDEGAYFCKGGVAFFDENGNEQSIAHGGIVWVNTAGVCYFSVTDGLESNHYLVPIIEPNVNDCVYMRCRASIPKLITVGTALKTGCYYINYGSADITYRSATIHSGEGFLAFNDTDSFTCSVPGYKIGCLWDDNQEYGGDVPTAEWVPAHTFGDYFVLKEDGAISHDDYNGDALGSGNSYSFQDNSMSIVTGKGEKSIANQPYVQFKIIVNRYDF